LNIALLFLYENIKVQEIAEGMDTEQVEDLSIINHQSASLKRPVTIDVYKPELKDDGAGYSLLLVNDGQDLRTMQFEKLFYSLHEQHKIPSLIVAAIHCGADRKNEYGMSVGPDYRGWGSKAGRYEKFVIRELLPLLHARFRNVRFTDISFAGFSLGGLSAFNIAWNHPDIFSTVGAFSASFWWRSIDKKDKDYDPWTHRMLHKQLLDSAGKPGMKFFFQCGEHDETEDRNKNGVIDSIDDTIDIMRILLRKGYREGKDKDFVYLQLADGRHDVSTWARALPAFLEWKQSIIS